MVSKLIALDIDGTLTAHIDHIPKEVIDYLHKLHSKGYNLLFITGRSFSFAAEILKDMSCPFHLAVQNGADLMSMPGSIHQHSLYLSKAVVQELSDFCDLHGEEFILYAGHKSGDSCYYRHDRLSADMRDLFDTWSKKLPAPWKSMKQIADLSEDSFPLFKIIGKMERLVPLLQKIRSDGIETALISAPSSSGLGLLMVTHPQVNKGRMVKVLAEKLGVAPEHVVAAGDDYNDHSMLKIAGFSIAMGSAPQELKDLAHFVAPPATELGILHGLFAATTIHHQH